MSEEKTEAIVIRQADFSESSRVVTFFSKDFGKVSLLAKGAKRLKGPFDAAIDLLSTCHIVFLRKTSGALGLLTQAQLVERFVPDPSQLNSLYGAYYVADLLNLLTEEFDADPRLYELTRQTLKELSSQSGNHTSAIVHFEVRLLRQLGVFPDLSACTVCGQPLESNGRYSYWVGHGGLLCGDCSRHKQAERSISGGSVEILKRLGQQDSRIATRLKLTQNQARECHQIAVSAITQILGRKPGTLRYLTF